MAKRTLQSSASPRPASAASWRSSVNDSMCRLRSVPFLPRPDTSSLSLSSTFLWSIFSSFANNFGFSCWISAHQLRLSTPHCSFYSYLFTLTIRCCTEQSNQWQGKRQHYKQLTVPSTIVIHKAQLTIYKAQLSARICTMNANSPKHHVHSKMTPYHNVAQWCITLHNSCLSVYVTLGYCWLLSMPTWRHTYFPVFEATAHLWHLWFLRAAYKCTYLLSYYCKGEQPSWHVTS